MNLINKPNSKYDHLFVVLRYDPLQIPREKPEWVSDESWEEFRAANPDSHRIANFGISGLKAFLTLEEAEQEAERLNKLQTERLAKLNPEIEPPLYFVKWVRIKKGLTQRRIFDTAIMMDYADKIITQTPLYELWNARGPMRGRVLNPEEIKSILRTGAVRFVVADIGGHLQWISTDDCFEFWKTVKPNIAKEDRFFLEDYPGEFAYVATEWKCESGETIIFLEMSH